VTPVRLSDDALRDVVRLPDFLAFSNPRAAERVRGVIAAGLAVLGEFPLRGRQTSDPRVRELPVRFGRYGYVIRYHVRASEIFVTRIRHVRERR
jgi:plasmid stabilization system protein ParE